MSFPSLYALALSKEAWVADFWDDTRGMRHWTLHFTRHFNDWELDIIETFFSMLRGNLVRRDDNNKVVWKDDKKGLLSVKSFYEVLDVGRVTWVIPSSVRVLLLSWQGSFVGKKMKKVWNIAPLRIFLTIWRE
ncbi:hypothetical protein CK203_004799 [Vitis vinifera]|uniref:Reverse transcriptase zinc-binding domain-containing protein n=1 Tax=Vitis vinifera TaxID=29760 RepID=A0A438KG38_VITVI|nr:hypothetical protein CK203_004799 [Vitis vinifera]